MHLRHLSDFLSATTATLVILSHVVFPNESSAQTEAGSRPAVQLKRVLLLAQAPDGHPRGTHEYARFIRPSELASSCRAAGLEVTELAGMQYNPLTQRYWLSADTSVNYLVACRRPA